MNKWPLLLGERLQTSRFSAIRNTLPHPPFKSLKRLFLAAAIFGTAFLVAKTQAQMSITLNGTNGMRAMKITFGGDRNYTPYGNFLFTQGSSNIANSSDSSLGVIISLNTFGESKFGSPHPYKAAIEGGFSFGQYVPFDSGLPMSRIANGAPNRFNVSSLCFFIAGGWKHSLFGFCHRLPRRASCRQGAKLHLRLRPPTASVPSAWTQP